MLCLPAPPTTQLIRLLSHLPLPYSFGSADRKRLRFVFLRTNSVSDGANGAGTSLRNSVTVVSAVELHELLNWDLVMLHALVAKVASPQDPALSP